MTKATAKQIQAEIKALKEIRPMIPSRTFFGDNNWDAIDAQIDVLENNIHEDTIWNRCDEEEPDLGEWKEHERDCALDARRWMDGEEPEARPSKNWQELLEARNE